MNISLQNFCDKDSPDFLAYWDNVNHGDMESVIFHANSIGKTESRMPKSSHNRVILFLRRDGSQNQIARWLNLTKRAQRQLARYTWEDELDMYFKVGEKLDNGRKILWTPFPIKDEMSFLQDLAGGNVFGGGVVM